MRYSSAARSLVIMVSILLLASGFADAGTLFRPAQTYPSGAWGTRSVAIADMNGDGKLDLVVLSYSGVAILLGNGDGTFQPAATFGTGLVTPSEVAVADLNGDAQPDVVVGANINCGPDPCSAVISVLLGRGDGTLGPPKTYASIAGGVAALALADVNRDHKPDLLVAWCADPYCETNGALGVLLGNGDGTFQAARNYDSGGRLPTALVVADLNGDGQLDVAISHAWSFDVGILAGNGDGTFQPVQTYNTNAWNSLSIAAADINGDGNPDLLVTNDCPHGNCSNAAVSVLLSMGHGIFQDGQNYSTSGIIAQSIAVADVNGDGKLDALVSHLCNGFCDTSLVAVLLGNGDGTFKNALRYFSGGRNAYQIAVADLNGDKKPDIVVANECVSYADCATGSVGVLLGMAGVFTTTTLSSSLNPSVFGRPVALTATVFSAGPTTPTGTVRFQSGSTGVGTAILSGGVATLTKTSLPAGTLSITATYNGDPNSAKSTSAPLAQKVKQASTTTTLVSMLNPSAQGQAVAFTVNVTSPTVRVTGVVTLASETTTLATVSLIAGKATFTTSALSKGAHQITATYQGTLNIRSSAASLQQIVH